MLDIKRTKFDIDTQLIGIEGVIENLPLNIRGISSSKNLNKRIMIILKYNFIITSPCFFYFLLLISNP